MSNDLWALVRADMDAHEYMAGVERTVERVRATGEIFTPTDLVIDMLSGVDLDMFAPGQTVLDPACGDGQFLMAARSIKQHHHGMSVTQACKDLYGVDIMADNVQVCRARLGGGTIVVGNTLRPLERVDGQTEHDHLLMFELFG
jgi:predicted RNA methylase